MSAMGTKTKYITVDSRTVCGLGAQTLHAVENPSIALQSGLRIQGSASSDSANLGSCSTVIFTIEKNPCVSGPVQFKPVLFKGQLYFLLYHSITAVNVSFILM